MRCTFRLLPVAALSMLGACAGFDTERDDLDLPEPMMTNAPSFLAASYSCEDGRKFKVRYLNNGDHHLAVLPVDAADELVFSSVAARSGAKYAAGRYVWWVRGKTATLHEGWDDRRPANGVSCKED